MSMVQGISMESIRTAIKTWTGSAGIGINFTAVTNKSVSTVTSVGVSIQWYTGTAMLAGTAAAHSCTEHV